MDFLMVFMASGIACGRGRTVAAADWRKMAAILQMVGWQRHAALFYFFDIGHPCYDQLTTAKTSYPLTSIMRPYRRFKFREPIEVTCVLIMSADEVPVFDWIAGSSQINLGKAVNANPGLNVNRIITLSSIQMFFTAFVFV